MGSIVMLVVAGWLAVATVLAVGIGAFLGRSARLAEVRDARFQRYLAFQGRYATRQYGNGFADKLSTNQKRHGVAAQ
jgi:hypothetical protein